MAQTKRKRRTKHRGNAAGGIEARGRTGRKLTAEEQKKAGGQARRDSRERKPPSWGSAAVKALVMACVLFALTRVGILGSKDTTIAQSVFLSVVALVLYTPLVYVTDKWVFNRQQRAAAQKKG